MPFSSSLQAGRREKILDAAQSIFQREGFRGATMERIASEARVSKVTLYRYFADKDAAFTAVAERLAGRLRSEALGALAKSGTLRSRLADALIAKHGMVFELVRTSAFSAELFENKARVAAKLFQQLDLEIEAALSVEIRAAGSPQAEADAIARLLFGAALGVAEHSPSPALAERDIRRLVDALV